MIFSRFSWNNIYYTLTKSSFEELNKIVLYYNKKIYLSFPFKRLELILDKNGRGKLHNPWNESEKAYIILVPNNMNDLIGLLFNIFEGDNIPINMKEN